MKTTRSFATLSLLTLSLTPITGTGCGDSDAPSGPPASGVAATSTPASMSVERVLADVDTGRDPAGTRAKLEGLLASPSLSKEERAHGALALAELLEGTDRPRAITLLEEATALGDNAAEKRLFAVLAGHEAPSWNRRPYDTPVADSARALSRYFPAATPDTKVEIDIAVFGGQDARATENVGTFAIGEAIREKAAEACGLCDEVKASVHTHLSREAYWSAFPRYEGHLEKSVVVVYVTEDTLMPEHYAKWLAAPVADVRAALARGQGLIAVKERAGSPPLVTLAAPRAPQFAVVEGAFAAMRALPKEPVSVKLAANLSSAEIQSGIRARYAALKGCYNALLQRRPTAAGKIDLAYAITGAGKLADVVVSLDGTLDEPEHRACVEKVVANVRYPAWSKDANVKVTVRYPITLSP